MKVPDSAQFIVRADIAVLDRNPEMADLDNPEGCIFGFAAYVVLELINGSRFSHFHHFLGYDEKAVIWDASRLMGRILDSKAVFLNDDLWAEIEPRYGSEAYEALELSDEERAA